MYDVCDGRNPCCSGPTPSTRTMEKVKEFFLSLVAIPVVVDLLLRRYRLEFFRSRDMSQSLL